MGLAVAFKAFFTALGHSPKAEQIERILSGQEIAGAPSEPVKRISEPPAKPVPKAPDRESAITLLATLQREARLVDLIQENLEQYTDAQVGAAARPCLQQCAGVLDRVLGLKPLVEATEGQPVEVGDNPSPTRYQWIGEATASSGKLVHHGWQASEVKLPTWTGQPADANIVAPAQIQAP
ncbi:DUF2760 domain-containing protein [Stieleria sp. TO1_6]|uniref:DUF2760 domain-containing protein n=1 Tax=Stieleria tagensis TaxID=2956795 RepID=UPI00209AB03E|nr:DUF2760 domain-containing protein [Stieleria tagensis]MCO8121665.1 DUF2760 domain-containing protein [Stieleria tagensis]